MNFERGLLKILKQRNLLIGQQSHPTGCWTIHCPWASSHSQQDSGTKYFEPKTNGYLNHGFKCFHKHCEHKKTEDFLSFLGIEIHHTPDPLPLFRSLESPQPYPLDALGPILGPAAQTLHNIIKAPDAICAQSVLAAASLVIQGMANVIIDGREIPLSLFLITVAESGERKSATDKIALKIVFDWQKMLTRCYREEFQNYQLQKERWEARKKEWCRDSNASTLLFEEPSPTPPMQPLILVEEPTYEGIIKYFSEQGYPSIGIFSDEGGRFLGGHAMNRDNRLKTISGISSLWDAKAISRMRSGDGSIELYGKRLSVHLMIQETILNQIFRGELLETQGFLPRCLISFPHSMAGHRIYVEEDLNSHPMIQNYYKALRLSLDRKLPLNPPPAPKNELNPRTLTLSPKAKELWIDFHNLTDSESATDKRLHNVRRFASKAPEHVLRISGVLTLIENPDATEIQLDCLQRSIQLIQYYLDELLRIQGFISTDPDLSTAASLLDWFWKQNCTQIGLSTIYQKGPSSLRSADRAKQIMSILELHGWVMATPNTVIDGKKHAKAWSIKANPDSE